MIFHGDCLDVLKTIPSGSIDSVITDPPYGMDYQSVWRSDRSKRFDKITNDKKPFAWFLHDAFRVLKDGGALICFTDWKNQDSWKSAIDWAGFDVKSHAIWDRGTHGMGDLKAAMGPKHDVIWFAVKGKFSFPNKRPTSIFNSQRISGEKLVHPTEKPVDLMAQLISAVTPDGGSVLDPFMGAGSTGIAAHDGGYKFIGIEKEEKYFAISKTRLGEK